MGKEITINQSEENWIMGIIKNKDTRKRIYNGDRISLEDIIPDKVGEFNEWLKTKI